MTKVLKIFQHAKSYLHVRSLIEITHVAICVYLLNKRMPDSNKYIRLCTKSRKKDKQLTN